MGRPHSRPPLASYMIYWKQAEEAELGLMIECGSEQDKAYTVNTLYECRHMFGGYEDIVIVRPGVPNTIFLLKKLEEGM